jgi:hypothetical protein
VVSHLSTKAVDRMGHPAGERATEKQIPYGDDRKKIKYGE